MTKYQFAPGARAALKDVLRVSLELGGDDGRRRYQALLKLAVRELATRLPDLLDEGLAKANDGLIVYHCRHSRDRAPERVGNPRHVIIARKVGDTLIVLNVVGDWMLTTRSATKRAMDEALRNEKDIYGPGSTG